MAGERLEKALARYCARYQAAERTERARALDALFEATGRRRKCVIVFPRKPADASASGVKILDMGAGAAPMSGAEEESVAPAVFQAYTARR